MSKAEELFTAIPKLHNCAQAVADGNNASAEQVATLATAGGGRAPEGVCGALYAAMLLAGDNRKDDIRQEFATILGADTCRALKSIGVPCLKCVQTADMLLNKK